MAAPSFVSAGAYLDGSDTSAPVAVPSGTAAGRVALVTMFLDGNAQTVTPASGFAAAEGIPSQITGVSGAHSLFVWWKRLTGSESGPWTFTWGSSAYREAIATLYTDVVAVGTPFDSPTDAAQDNAGGTVTPAVDVTTLGPDRLLIWAATNWSGGTWTAPTGFTKRAQDAGGVFTTCDDAFLTEANTGAVTGSCTGSDKRCAWMGALIGTTSAASATAPPFVRRPSLGALLQL